MPTSQYYKFDCFVEDRNHGKHNLSSDALKAYITTTTPDAANHAKKADLAEIATGNGYNGPVAINITSSGQTGGTYSLVGDDLTPMFTASGGSVTGRYVVIYNDTHVDDPLICYYDYGSTFTVNDGEPFNVDFPANIFTDQ